LARRGDQIGGPTRRKKLKRVAKVRWIFYITVKEGEETEPSLNRGKRRKGEYDFNPRPNLVGPACTGLVGDGCQKEKKKRANTTNARKGETKRPGARGTNKKTRRKGAPPQLSSQEGTKAPAKTRKHTLYQRW